MSRWVVFTKQGLLSFFEPKEKSSGKNSSAGLRSALRTGLVQATPFEDLEWEARRASLLERISQILNVPRAMHLKISCGLLQRHRCDLLESWKRLELY